MAKNTGKKGYENFISDVVAKIVKQAEEDEQMDDLIENSVEFVVNDSLFKEKILGHLISKPKLKKELIDSIIDEICD